MATQFDTFIATMKKVLMLDQADLDFGIYRIMNQKRAQIESYLNNDLRKQVAEAIRENTSADAGALKKELAQLITTLTAAGMNPNDAPKVKELKDRIAQCGNSEVLENEIYSHLSIFFGRYYDGGDFISQRRYKKDVYAIPYEGEEVKLYWANADQYYIKTGEYFRNYRFAIGNDKFCEFTLREASTEQNNNVAQNNMERRFALYEETPVEVIGDTLHIYFTYELYPKATKQKALVEKAFNVVKDAIPAEFMSVLVLRPTENDRTRTLLQKHLNDYVARNTFDYFIHKDLGGFLSRELDFYIKNEILVIDDINARTPDEFLKHLTVIKAIKMVGMKLITFLASLENYQKRLWLKKKFVVESNYCITLDRVPDSLYAEIAANDAQREEWIRLFAIDEIKAEAANGFFSEGKTGYSVPLTVEFLNENPFLVLDTKFFTSEFKNSLLASIDNIDEQCDGLLINSENFQALELLQEKYKEQVKCIYIDPPYNTGTDGFVYKDGYTHSTWLSMMNDRISIARNLQDTKSIFFASINENELYNLEKLLNNIYGEQNYLSTFTVKVRHEDRILKGDKEIHEVYENLCLYKNSNDFYINKREKDNTSLEEYVWEVKTLTPPSNEIELGGKHVEIYNPGTYTFIKHETGFEDGLKRISIRGSIREGNSSGRFYTGNLENLNSSYKGCLFKVQGIGAGKLLYRWFWMPDLASGRKNGDYFQDVPIDRKDIIQIPYPNFVDFEQAFNNCADEGGTIFRNGKKPTAFLDHVFDLANLKKIPDGIILDFFSGSGSTGHAVINLNREDGGKRKYILCEMGEYFNTVTKPRMQKVIYSKDWDGGKPVSREGSSHCFKYMRLEQYEDTLNNLTLQPANISKENADFYGGYMLGYMLDIETRDSLFNMQWFKNPWNMKLRITRQNETHEENIDVIETFNYLIGLNVRSILYPKKDICAVEGITRSGERTLVIWRNCDTVNNDALNDFFRRMDYSTRDTEFDRIYVNGDNNLENLRTDEAQWKVVLIEQEFAKRMFQEN